VKAFTACVTFTKCFQHGQAVETSTPPCAELKSRAFVDVRITFIRKAMLQNAGIRSGV
jgi:hypothetical protein